MTRVPMLRARYLLQRLGPVGWLGLFLLVGAAALSYAGAGWLPAEIQTRRVEIERTRLQLEALRARTEARRAPSNAQELLAALPALDQVPAFIEDVHDEAARRGLLVDRAEYRQNAGQGAGFATRLQVVLPVRGEYPPLRRWLETLLYRHPSLALDEFSLKRATEGSSTLEARVVLSFYARGTP